MRLGGQEWRCRGTIGKEQQQRWSRPRRILRPTLSDQLVIKAGGAVPMLGREPALPVVAVLTVVIYSDRNEMML